MEFKLNPKDLRTREALGVQADLILIALCFIVLHSYCIFTTIEARLIPAKRL